MATATQTGMTKQQAIETVKAAFPFEVKKFPLSGPDNVPTPFFGLFRSDNFETIGSASVSDRYVPHKTDDVVALAESACEVFDDQIGVKCHFRDGHFLTLSPSAEYRRQIFQSRDKSDGGDNIYPRIIIKAGCDGEAFRASIGFYRDVCKNLAIIRTVGESSVAIRHTNGLRGKMDELRKSFESLRGAWDKVVETVAMMTENKVNFSDYLNSLYPVPAKAEGREVTTHKNRNHLITSRLLSERNQLGFGRIPADGLVTAWEAFNAVQGYVQHDATRKSEFNNEFDRMILSLNDPIVRKAESLALAAV